ncbi:MAG: DUF4476 domain-containing protein [Bacteroidetes bacterium]|nr:MAG: DUF4476 domain-containing protein [Bacteroidota bacterium]TAG92782.1 MAG: DUF4476 domain-containing protein [Bacteroidota bacterium]
MKKLMFLLLVCFQINAFAQNNSNQNGTLTIFADDGVRFWVSVNGERKNSKAAANVKIPTDANSYWKAKIIFENQQLPEITKSVYTSNKGEVVYRVRKNRRGNYVVRLFSAPQDAGLSVENDDNASNQPINNNVSNNSQNQNNNNSNNQNNQNNNNRSNTEEKVVIDINGIRTEVKAGENEVEMNLPGGVNTRVVTPNNDPFSNNNWDNNNNNQNNNNSNNQNNNNQNSNNNQNNNNNNNCQNSMNDSDFGRALKSLQSQSFEDTKMTVAKQFTKANCLSVSQIKSVMKQFSFEKTKLDFAKFAHTYCYNKNNYYELNDAFNFDSSVKELNNYLEGK